MLYLFIKQVRFTHPSRPHWLVISFLLLFFFSFFLKSQQEQSILNSLHPLMVDLQMLVTMKQLRYHITIRYQGRVGLLKQARFNMAKGQYYCLSQEKLMSPLSPTWALSINFMNHFPSNLYLGRDSEQFHWPPLKCLINPPPFQHIESAGVNVIQRPQLHLRSDGSSKTSHGTNFHRLRSTWVICPKRSRHLWHLIYQ